MAKTATYNMRIDPAVKKDAEQLFASFGLTLSDAINIFFHQCLIEGGIPFEIRQAKRLDEEKADEEQV